MGHYLLARRGVGVVGIEEGARKVVVYCGREGVRNRSSAVVGMGVMGVAGLEGADLLVMVGHQEQCHYRSEMREDLAGAVVEAR